MAFTAKNLCNIGTGGDNSLFLYTTEDADTVVQADDYFLNAYNTLKVGDFIMCNMDTDGTRETKVIYVTASASTGVDTGFPTIT